MAALQNISELYGAWFAIRLSQSELGHFFPPGKYHLSAGTKNGGKTSRDEVLFLRGTNGTKRKKYGEKYSGVNAALVFVFCCASISLILCSCLSP